MPPQSQLERYHIGLRETLCLFVHAEPCQGIPTLAGAEDALDGGPRNRRTSRPQISQDNQMNCMAIAGIHKRAHPEWRAGSMVS